jgi:hypothetical protein
VHDLVIGEDGVCGTASPGCRVAAGLGIVFEPKDGCNILTRKLCGGW